MTRSAHISTRQPLSRRQFLRGAGIALSLPFLESMLPVFGRTAVNAASKAAPYRMIGICNNLGLLGHNFFPKDGGTDYTLSPYLQTLAPHRDHFSVFSGVSHPSIDSGHPGDVCFLTAAPNPGSGSFRNTISLDQTIAEHVGIHTRFPSLTLSVNSRSRSLSWTGSGVAIPPEEKASEVFKQLFVQGNAQEVKGQMRELDNGKSILDTISGEASQLKRGVTARDRDRLDQYFTSVRDLENRLQASKAWSTKPKPVVTAAPPIDPADPAAYMDKVKVMYDLTRLAFETDSTRAITLMLDGVSTPALEIPDAPITEGYHNLSHHGKSESKLSELKVIDEWHMKLLEELIRDLKTVNEDDGTLLDRTMVLYGSNFGDANAHTCNNMPIILAGGGFNHGQHHVFNRERNYPLPNLYLTMLHRMGIEANAFASSSGTMSGVEFK